MKFLSRLKSCIALLSKAHPEALITRHIIKSADPETLIEWLMESENRIKGFDLTCDYADEYRLKLNVCSGHTFRDIILYGSYQMDIMKLIASKLDPKSLLFIDVGANIGTTILNAHFVGFRKFLAFEPIKENFDDLVYNMEQIQHNSDLDLRMLAVSNKKEKLPMHLNETACGRHSFKVDFQYKTEVVETTTLDDIGIIEDNFLLIDTEGFELEVLQGAKDLIKNTKGVCAEITPRYISSQDLEELRVFLNKHFSQHFICGKWLNRDVTKSEFFNNNEQYDIISLN